MKPVIDPVSPLREDPRGRAFDRIGAFSVFLAALGARLYYLHQLRETPLFAQLRLDPLYYVEWGRRIAAGDWLSGTEAFEQSPLYAYILAGIFRAAGEGLLAPRLVQAVAGSLTCLVVFYIGRRLLGRSAGLAAGLLAALYAPGIFYDGMVMKTAWAVLLAAGMTLALVASEGSRRSMLFTAGLLLGLASLVRDNLILLSPILAIWLAADTRIRGQMTRGWIRESAARVAFFAAGLALAIAPVAARNMAVSGEPVLLTAGGGEVFYIGNNPEADGRYSPPPFVRATGGLEHEDFRAEAARRLGHPVSRSEASAYWLSEGIGWIRAHPREYVALLDRKFLIFVNAYELPDNQSFEHHRRFVPALRGLPTWALLFPLAAAGFVMCLRRWRDLLPLYVIGGGYLGTVLLFFNFGRFRMPLVPVLLVFAGGALAGLPGLVPRRGAARRAVATAGAAVAALALALMPVATDALHRGQSDSDLAELMARAGRIDEARELSGSGLRLIESVYADAGGSLDDAGRVAPVGRAGRPALGESYYAVLMEACRTRAAIARRDGDDPGALAWSARAAAAAPDSIIGRDALTGYAEALLVAGRPAEALPTIIKARGLDPSAFRPALVHAEALHRTGHPEEALRVVEAALDSAVDPSPLDLADAAYGMGLIHRDLGDIPGMRFHLRETLNRSPDHPMAARIRRLLAEADGAEGLQSFP